MKFWAMPTFNKRPLTAAFTFVEIDLKRAPKTPQKLISSDEAMSTEFANTSEESQAVDGFTLYADDSTLNPLIELHMPGCGKIILPGESTRMGLPISSPVFIFGATNNLLIKDDLIRDIKDVLKHHNLSESVLVHQISSDKLIYSTLNDEPFDIIELFGAGRSSKSSAV